MKTQVHRAFPFDSYIVKVINVLRFLIYILINFLITIPKQTKNPKSLLIIRLDSIGDYLLVRNFFCCIKQSKKYQDYKITLCGSTVWKDLTETFDNRTFDNFIWIDRDKFHNNILHKYRTLKNIYLCGFESVIDTTCSREFFFGDSIVKTTNANIRIGSEGVADSHIKWKKNLLTDKYYTKLIQQSSKNIFEFNRNKEFFEIVLNERIELNKPLLDGSLIEIKLPTPKEFAVIFPGAKEEKRQWSSSNFEMIIEHLIAKHNLDVIVAGSDKDSIISRKMFKGSTSKACFDLTGKTSLPQLAKLISLSKILISNETSAVHFAAAVGTPFVCISNGNHFGRFNPYPKEMSINGKYVYPEEIEKNLNDFEFLSNKYRFESNLDINSIHFDKVKSVIEELL